MECARWSRFSMRWLPPRARYSSGGVALDGRCSRRDAARKWGESPKAFVVLRQGPARYQSSSCGI
jgi:hypothetical protein